MGLPQTNNDEEIIVNIFKQIKSKEDKNKIINFALALKKKQGKRVKPTSRNIGYKGAADRKDLYDEK
ncbi:MAG: hypothetical protein BWY32_03297 [bacterium ADurb.Bin243]|nr:MAG: hypothetical protein BWY32_03297 [bacterium ADurb.Bin243]